MSETCKIILEFSTTLIVQVKTRLSGTMLDPESPFAKVHREDAQKLTWNDESHILVTEDGREIEICIDNIQELFKYFKPSVEEVNAHIDIISDPDSVMTSESDGKEMS